MQSVYFAPYKSGFENDRLFIFVLIVKVFQHSLYFYNYKRSIFGRMFRIGKFAKCIFQGLNGSLNAKKVEMKRKQLAKWQDAVLFIRPRMQAKRNSFLLLFGETHCHFFFRSQKLFRSVVFVASFLCVDFQCLLTEHEHNMFMFMYRKKRFIVSSRKDTFFQTNCSLTLSSLQYWMQLQRERSIQILKHGNKI